MVFLFFIAALSVAILHLVYSLAWAVSILFAILIACAAGALFYIAMLCFTVIVAIRMANKFEGED